MYSVYSVVCSVFVLCFKSFLMFIIVFVVGITVLSNCSLFRVFQICVKIVLVIVKSNFLVLDGNDEAE